MKRLVAYVRHEPDKADIGPSHPRLEWTVDIEHTSGARLNVHDEPSVTTGRTFASTAIAAMAYAEQTAREYGFGLTWHGFVAHGFEIVAEKTSETGGVG